MRTKLSEIAAWWALAGGVILLVIVAVTSWNVGAFLIDRLGADVRGLPGYEDAVRLLISCAGLMFFPYCQDRRGHVAVDFFVKALPSAVRGALDRLWLGCTALAAVFLAYWMLIGLVETQSDQTSSGILGWREWPFYIPGIVSLVLWAAIAAAQCAEASRREPGHGA